LRLAVLILVATLAVHLVINTVVLARHCFRIT
jgi:hypothetical protein